MLKFEKIGRFDRLKSFSNRSHLPQLDRRVSNSLKTAHTFPESRKPTAKKRNATIIDTKTENRRFSVQKPKDQADSQTGQNRKTENSNDPVY